VIAWKCNTVEKLN